MKWLFARPRYCIDEGRLLRYGVPVNLAAVAAFFFSEAESHASLRECIMALPASYLEWCVDATVEVHAFFVTIADDATVTTLALVVFTKGDNGAKNCFPLLIFW